MSKMLDGILEDINKEKGLVIQLREKYKNVYKPGVSIIVPTFKKNYMNNIFSNYDRSEYPVKELIIILNNNVLDISHYQEAGDKYKDVKVICVDEKCTLGECLNIGISNSKYNYIARMDDDDYYGPHYLTDTMNVFNYSDVQMTGKNPVFVYLEENKSLYLFKHTNPVIGATFLFKKDVFEKVKFRNLNFREDFYFLYDCCREGIKIYPSDKYNYVYMRHINLKDHTFRCPSEYLIKIYDIKKVLTLNDFQPFVSV